MPMTSAAEQHPFAVEVLGGEPPQAVRRPAVHIAAVRRFDQAVDRRFERLRGRPRADRLFYAASALGDFSLLWHLVGVGRAVASTRREREMVRLASALSVETVLVNGIVKSFFRRTRPAWEQPRPL